MLVYSKQINTLMDLNIYNLNYVPIMENILLCYVMTPNKQCQK